MQFWALFGLSVASTSGLLLPPEDGAFVTDFPRQSTQWPYPKSGVVKSIDPPTAYRCLTATTYTLAQQFREAEASSDVIAQAWAYLMAETRDTPCRGGTDITTVAIQAEGQVSSAFGPDMDEWYKLEYDGATRMIISARSVWGARHAIQTLHNMLEIYNPGSDGKLGVDFLKKEGSHLVLPYGAFSITDEPRLSYRGFHLDTARHYISWKSLYQIIGEMRRSKLNVFHWHATDDQSFPLVMENSAPLIHGPECYEERKNCRGAFTDQQIYHQADVLNFIKFAKQHGVRVVLEIDQPAHARSWGSYNPALRECDQLEHQVEGYCLEPICGILALKTNFEEVFKVGKAIVADVDEVIEEGEIFHLGMDEIGASCWGEESRDQLTMKWLERIAEEVKPTGHQIMVWQDGLHSTHADVPPAADDAIVQVWLDMEEAQTVLNKGHDVVWSPYSSMYLDCGRGNVAMANFQTWCDPYKTWWTVYKEAPDLLLNTNATTGKVLGGETPLWAEQVDDTTVGPLLFPRIHSWGGAAWEARDRPVVDPSSDKPDSLDHITRLVEAQEQLRRLTQLTRLDGVPAMDSQTAWCMYEDQEYCDHFASKFWEYVEPGPEPEVTSGTTPVVVGLAVTVGVTVLLSH